ncbi:hypothetical protein BD324DRAFT_638821 [Kockovaella imperatae]|uniref:Opsin n=1 Tax=Kockovaella imperatae TaxID=4999 RepID=A0A1Y1U8M8_9TREE|nr:hypothetical protein BD324DRAFT_638821 [Kockovaella imperatae]ORX33837.1 hypothetical protein BD324DRAFT_638821 [Kockovaella imperatae]
MANASEKRRATTNEASLRSLRVGLLLVNTLSAVLRFVLCKLTSKPLFSSKKIIFLHVTTLLVTLFIWRWFTLIGTPKRVNGSVKAGDDLNASGVIELSWDFVYLTWICVLLSSLVGDWVWWLFILIPIFAGYKLFTLFRPLLGMFLPGIFGPRSSSAAAAQEHQAEPTESRKQQKLRARMEKGDKRVQQVQK